MTNENEISFESSYINENSFDDCNSSFYENSTKNIMCLSQIYESENDYNNNADTTTNTENSKEIILPTITQIPSAIISAVINSIQNIITNSNNIDKNTAFYSDIIPTISLNDYLNRIIKYTEIEKKTLIIALIYIDKYSLSRNETISIHIIHKILFAAVLLSIKYNEDLVYTNEYYSLIAGIPLKEMNQIEYEFLNQINFNLFINEDLYNTYNKLF
jgi:hypothetical protein